MTGLAETKEEEISRVSDFVLTGFLRLENHIFMIFAYDCSEHTQSTLIWFYF